MTRLPKELFCKQVREAIYLEASAFIRRQYSRATLTVGSFSPDVFHAIRMHWGPEKRRYEHWDWKAIHQGVVNKPCRFEAVICNGRLPLGLVLGKPDRSGRYLGIPFLEAYPARHPLTGETAANLLAIARTYAQELGLKEIRLLNPIEELIGFYQALGFQIARSSSKELYLVQATGEQHDLRPEKDPL